MTAFDQFAFQIRGLDWLDSERYSVEALVPPGAGKDDLKAMLKDLIIDRFQITYTVEKLPLDGFLLSLDRGSAKLTPSGPPAIRPSPLKLLPGKSPFVDTRVSEGMLQKASMRGDVRLAGFSVAVATLSQRLAELLQCPVENDTGLTGYYDIDLAFSDEQAIMGPGGVDANPPAELPGLFTAIREQLGLKLVRGKMETPMMTIQSAQKKPRTD